MKTIKTILAVVIISSYFSCVCHAQQVGGTPAEWVKEHEKEINTSAYIFEGTVTQQKCYYGKPGIMTCSVIQITKIYKGSPQIKLGTIKVIEEGGHIDNTPYVNPSDGGWVLIGKGGTYIIFGQPSTFEPADTNMLHTMATDNTMTLLLCCVDPINFDGKGAAQWDDTKYLTVDSLYSFLKQNGLTVEEEAQQK
jgi:hypothetical protein